MDQPAGDIYSIGIDLSLSICGYSKMNYLVQNLGL